MGVERRHTGLPAGLSRLRCAWSSETQTAATRLALHVAHYRGQGYGRKMISVNAFSRARSHLIVVEKSTEPSILGSG